MLLEARGLSCRRGDRLLFENLEFQLQSGRLLFVEGKNGTGKTTLLRILCGLFMPEAGQILWNGQKTHKLGEDFRQHLFYLGHLNGIKGDLTAVENLSVMMAMTGEKINQSIIWDALKKMGLYGHEDVPTRQLSQGQKRRVALARLLLTKTQLWILDEPFVALDKAAVELLQSIIANHINNDGMAILTTHQEVPLTQQQTLHLQLGS